MKKYILIISMMMFFASCTEHKNDKANNTTEKKSASFQTIELDKSALTSLIKLPGQLSAFEEVSIFPKVNGYVKSVTVDIGSKVHAGQLLMVLEAPELVQAALQAKEKYARAKSDYAIDKDRYQRLLEASKTAGAISPLDLSSAQNKMQADSSLANAEKANWQMQETMLSYLNVTAAFDGIITERNVHPGALVSNSEKDKPMLELKQYAHLRLQVDIPETMATQLKDKDTVSFYVNALPGKKMTATISRKSMNISSQLHSERIEMDVWNKDGLLSPGMYADVLLYSKGNAMSFIVPKSAVITSTERKYVLVIKDGKTVKVDVSTGNETADQIEIFGNLNKGEKIIINATDEIKEGVAVS